MLWLSIQTGVQPLRVRGVRGGLLRKLGPARHCTGACVCTPCVVFGVELRFATDCLLPHAFDSHERVPMEKVDSTSSYFFSGPAAMDPHLLGLFHRRHVVLLRVCPSKPLRVLAQAARTHPQTLHFMLHRLSLYGLQIRLSAGQFICARKVSVLLGSLKFVCKQIRTLYPFPCQRVY